MVLALNGFSKTWARAVKELAQWPDHEIGGASREGSGRDTKAGGESTEGKLVLDHFKLN